MARDKGRMRMRMRAGAVLRIDIGAWVSPLCFFLVLFSQTMARFGVFGVWNKAKEATLFIIDGYIYIYNF